MPGRDQDRHGRDHWDDEEAARGRYRSGAEDRDRYEDDARRETYAGFAGGGPSYGPGVSRRPERLRDVRPDPGRRADYRTERGYTRHDGDAIGGPYTDYGHAMGGYGAGGGYTPNPDEGVGRERRSWDERSAPGSWFGQAPDESWRADGWRGERRSFEAQRTDGPHRGRGPKGYTRSGERIREDVSDRLTDDPLLDASDIEVLVEGTEVTLNGTVDSRAAKRRAEDRADDATGVTHVQNNLRVRAPAGTVGAETDPRIAAVSEGRDTGDAPEHMRREER